jgi:TolB-like protein/Tfp pilus assembly protein PilF
MPIWSSEIKILQRLYESLKGQLPDLEKELGRLIKADDENMILLYSRRCLEVIIIDLCECELKRQRGTEPLKGIIDKLHKERKVPDYISTSMHGLNDLSTYGAHPKDFDPEQVKPTLNNLDIIIKWYLKFKGASIDVYAKPPEEIRKEPISTEDVKKSLTISRKRLVALLSGLMLLIVIVFSVLFLTNIIGSGKPTNEIEKSIAVLPFFNDSPSDSTTYFINGLMDDILNNLQTIGAFSKVLSRSSTEQYRGTNRPPIPKIAKDLDVNFIVEGSGQKYGKVFRIRVQLIDGKTDKHLWVGTYEKEIKAKDIYDTQSEIAESIAEELKATITPEEKQLIEKTPTTNLTAYDFYKRGREEYLNFWSENINLRSLKKAEKYYYKALEYDSTFALAYAGLALTFCDRTFATNNYLSKNFLDSTLILADRALSFDNHLAEAYYSKGLYFLLNNNDQQAIKEFDNVLKYNPNYWEVYYQKAMNVYLHDISYIKAIECLRKAISLNRGRRLPECLNALGSAYAFFAGFPEKGEYYFQEAFKLDGDTISYYSTLAELEFEFGNESGNYQRGIDLLNMCYARDSNNIGILYSLSKYYMRQNNYKESLNFINKYVERLKASGQIPLNRSHRVGYIYWINGYKKEAEYWFNEQKRICEATIKLGRNYSAIGRAAYYDLAGVYAFQGKKEKVYENLKAFARMPICSFNVIYIIKNDELFSNIRNEPEFQQFVRDMEAKYQAEHERVKKWLEEQGMLQKVSF